MTVLLLAILAHFIADFILQTSTMIDLKNRFCFSGYLWHGLVCWVLTVALLHCNRLGTVIVFSLIIASAHIVIDYLKCLLCKKKPQIIDMTLFFLDQAVHLGLIFWIWQVFEWRPNKHIIAFYQTFLTPKTVAVFSQRFKTPGFNWDYVLAGIIVYVVIVWGGAIVIRKILNNIEGISGNDALSQKAGYYIGLLERVIILTMVLFDGLGSIAFILTAKSIARFNELNNKKFAEYYLIGTLLSTALAIGGGLFLKFISTII